MEIMKNANAYIARCHRTLKSWGAPIIGWICIDTYDITGEGWIEGNENGLFTCELCKCPRVRYVHVMQHDNYFENVSVGCICAGIMEGNILAAKEREKILRNRAKRKQNYLKRGWKTSINGNKTLKYKGEHLTIINSKFSDGGFGVVYNGGSVWQYKNKKITNFLSAMHAAFDIADPLPKQVK